MKNLEFGSDTNLLELIVDNIDITPVSQLRRGDLRAGVKIKISSYNIDNLLCQIIDDYGEDNIIERIKNL